MSSEFFSNVTEVQTIEPPSEGLAKVIKSSSSFNKDGNEYFVLEWRPQVEKFKALVYLCHGFGEYLDNGVYEDIAQLLSANGMLVFGHDHIGHGKSSGERAQVSKCVEVDYIEPIVEHCKERKRINNGIPLIIDGHSLGGFMTVFSILTEPDLFDYCLLVAPFVEPAPDMATPMNIFLAKWLSPLLPSFQPPGSALDDADITRDKDWVQRIKNDKSHWHGGVKLRQGYAVLKSVPVVENNLPNFKTPIFIQQGSGDKICLPSGSEKLHRLVSSTDKTLEMYDGAFHSLFIELEDVKKEVYDDQLKWILERIDN